MKILMPSSAFKLNIIYYFATTAITEYQLAVFHTVSQFYRAEIQAHNIGEMGFFRGQGGEGLSQAFSLGLWAATFCLPSPFPTHTHFFLCARVSCVSGWHQTQHLAKSDMNCIFPRLYYQGYGHPCLVFMKCQEYRDRVQSFPPAG